MTRRVLVAALLLATLTGFGVGRLTVATAVGTGYAAKLLCSLAFNSGQPPQAVYDRYVSHEIWPLGPFVRFDIDPEIDRSHGRVTARALGLAKSVAVYRAGLGCTLAVDADPDDLVAEHVPPRRAAPPSVAAPWPAGDAPPAEPPSPALRAAIDRAFAEPPAGRRRQTTVVLVAHGGRLIAERYANGYGPDTPMLSWSMAKMVLGALIGLAVEDGLLVLDDSAPVAEWRHPTDPRRAITLDQLLRMSSGLVFGESTWPFADLPRMLYANGDTGSYAAAKPVDARPGSVWRYSSGTSNLLARILRDALGGDLASRVRWTRERFFDRVGMHSAFIEPDAAGSFVLSSYVFATARDWARFGELYRHDGVWQGERVLPERWVRYQTTPTPTGAEGRFGAHFWTNAPADGANRHWPGLPADTIAALGHSGQYLLVVPSAELVVVRLGLGQGPGDELHGAIVLTEEILGILGS